MSISGLSSTLITDLAPQQRQNPFQQIKQDFEQLASALQSGDLSGAQSDYSNIQQILQANPGASSSSTSSTGSNTLQTDFAALGQALQSGNLNTAQNAFDNLQSDFQASRTTAGTGAGAPAQAPTEQQDQYVSTGQNPIQQALEDYTQLGSDLQSGNLTAAQSDYSALNQLVQAYQGPSSSDAAIQTDFATLGQDLQSGNLSQSQSDFTQLQSDLNAATQTAAAATSSATTPEPNPAQQVRQDYGQLASALQSGSLTDAQAAFAALEQALQTQSGSSSTSTPASTTSSTASADPIANDLNAIGQALTSGNLTQAQSAFSQLQTDIKAAEQSSGTRRRKTPGKEKRQRNTTTIMAAASGAVRVRPAPTATRRATAPRALVSMLSGEA
jgi:outer membrane protein assembly factor BamD (BamD/ComL family)